MRSTASATLRIVAGLLPLALTMTTPTAATPQDAALSFEERFALAEDRAALLEELIPGTADHYFYACLVAQHRGAYAEVPPLVDAWRERHRRDRRIDVIETRQALLTYSDNPEATYRYLERELRLKYEHERTLGGARPELSSTLDPALVSAAAFAQAARARHPNDFRGWQPHALRDLASSALTDRQLRDLLSRLRLPDVPNLPALVVRDLEAKGSDGFGTHPIHGKLLLNQLEQCAQALPKLLDSSAFLEAYLRRLQPGPDVDLELDSDARLEHLERLQNFVQRLSPAHNSLKAHVLHHRLQLDLEREDFDRGRLVEYLRLPRETNWVNRAYQKRQPRDAQRVQLGAKFATGLPPIQGDEELVRAHLEHWFQTQDTIAGFSEFVNQEYLERALAETRILAGDPDAERWYSLLDNPSYYERLQERVELDFVPGNQRLFGRDEAVRLELDVKNVRTLIVKVFEVNALNYYLAEGRELSPDIDLDGLVAGEETTYTYDEPALRRVRREFAFPALSQPGTYVVEFIGNGLSSRAILHKGRLGYVQRTGAAGHVFQVLDENGALVSPARLHLDGRQFQSDERGEIVVPFTSSPSRKRIVLEAGRLAALDQFRHQRESYGLDAGFLVDRESLIAGARTRFAVRPQLQLAGEPVSLELLDSTVVTLTTVDLDGVSSELVLRDVALESVEESVHEFRVPDRIVSLQLSLTGRVRSVSEGEWVELSAQSELYSINGIDATAATEALLIGRGVNGYALDLLGKNGEPRADRVVQVRFYHEDYTVDRRATLRTDDKGRVTLGALPGIQSVRATLDTGTEFAWSLEDGRVTWPNVLHGVAGETLRVPIVETAEDPRALASLFELRDGQYTTDRTDLLRVRDGSLELTGLAPGDYALWLREARGSIAVRVVPEAGPNGWARSATRRLELASRLPLNVVETRVEGEELVVRLTGHSPDTRVHISASRYLPEFDRFGDLALPGDQDLAQLGVPDPRSSYHAGRTIGDEYRYILERRLATKFPGNMLVRPSLILNPWVLEEVETAIGLGGGSGGRFGGRMGGKRKLSAAGGSGSQQRLQASGSAQPNLDFLPVLSTPALNLRPAEDGTLRLPLGPLGDGQLIQVVAVDRTQTALRTHALEELPLEPRDRRLTAAFDATAPLSEQRGIDFVQTGGQLVIDDMATSSLEVYDSLDDVYDLFRTRSGNGDLETFSFLLRWPQLADVERRALYSKHACHELHVFLHEKDRPFFDAVVRPYLANKRHKEFLDRWLLEEDLADYLDPWAFGQLNVVERILLTRTIADRREDGARLVRELFAVLPPELTREGIGFEDALKSAALEPEKGFAAPQPSGPATPGPARGRNRVGAIRPDAEAPAELSSSLDALGYSGGEEDEEAPELSDAPGGGGGGSDDFFLGRNAVVEQMQQEAVDLDGRESARRLYRPLDETRAMVEHNYYHRRIEDQNAGLITVNGFWRDFADAGPDGPFVSSRFPEAVNSFAEMLLALSFLDLPFQSAEHESTYEDGRLTLNAAGPLLAVSRQLRPASAMADAQPLLVSQDLYRLDDPVAYVDGEAQDKFVRDEFLVGVAYGCRVVVTNPTSSRRRLEVLMQVPQGAIPVNGCKETRGQALVIEPYGTARLEYSFYFPVSGGFPHYPVQAAQEGELVAAANAMTLNVVEEATKIDTTSWEHVSQLGTGPEVLEYLGTANLQRIDVGRIAWRMKDKAFYDATTSVLRQRLTYHDALWSYGVRHRDERSAREFLAHHGGLAQRVGRWIDTPLAALDPVERRAYQHIEFDPLFNPRAHAWQGKRELLNAGLGRQYPELLRILAYRPALDDDDRMSVVYYLLLQDRIEEALAQFERVDPANLKTRLQYDYMRAYLCFFTEELETARQIAETHVDHPIERWRERFAQVLAHLDEAQGGAPVATGGDDGGPSQDALAGTEPVLELEVEGRQVVLSAKNLDEVEVRYYPMDVEFLFSANPFVQQGSGSFAYVQPARADVHAVPGEAGALSLELPEEFQSSNVLVEVRGGGLTRRQASYAGTFQVQTMENYGQLRVTAEDGRKPLSKVYVKVFAQLENGETRFHKDGYTDLRGRFDYMSLSGASGAAIERFALLVLSEEHGATIREVEPPTR